jgi:hypothetical protein
LKRCRSLRTLEIVDHLRLKFLRKFPLACWMRVWLRRLVQLNQRTIRRVVAPAGFCPGIDVMCRCSSLEVLNLSNEEFAVDNKSIAAMNTHLRELRASVVTDEGGWVSLEPAQLLSLLAKGCLLCNFLSLTQCL